MSDKLQSYQVKAPSYFMSKIWFRDQAVQKKRRRVDDTDCVVVENLVEGENQAEAGTSQDVTVVDGDSSFLQARKRRTSHEIGRHFQESWSAIFPWCEELKRENGEVAQVKCTVCSRIEGRQKILLAKLDGLKKHAGRKKADKDIPALQVKKGDFYVDPASNHVKNEKLIFSLRRDTVVQQLVASSSLLRKKKAVQFHIILWLLKQGRPMSDYGAFLPLFALLKVPELPTKHWCDTSAWQMAYAMCDIVSRRTKDVVTASTYFSLSADEVTSVDNQQWLSMHIYVMKDWQRRPILLSLHRVTSGCDADNLKHMITGSARWHGGCSEEELSAKLVCFGADGASVFQGSRTGVSQQIIESNSPYMLKMHCMAHRTNLAVQAISKLSLVKSLESLCANLYSYLGKSPKRALEFQVLADSLSVEGLKILRNVKTRWISVYDPIVRIRDSFSLLVAKMALDVDRKKKKGKASKKGVAALKNLDLLTDIQTLLAIPCILPMLSLVNDLIKFAQSRDVFVCDFISAVKMCETDLECKYVDAISSYSTYDFPQFTELVENRSYCMLQEWVTDLNNHIEYLSYRIGDHTYPCHTLDSEGRKQAVTREDFAQCILVVKQQCTLAATCLIKELRERFPDSELMSALGIVFPQFWRQADCDTMFPVHLSALKKHYGVGKTIQTGACVPEALSIDKLDEQVHIFKITMKNNAAAAMGEPLNLNPLTKLWQTVGGSPLLRLRISEYFKLAEIAVVCVIGSVEDERTFSTLSFIKNKLRNKLTTNLDCTVRMFAQDFFTLADFPFVDAISDWMDKRDRRNVAD